MTETKNRLSALLAEVRAGETVLILDRGVPVARLEPVTAGDDADGRLARLQRAGVLIPARAEPALELALADPPAPEPGASAVQALLDERRTGR